MVHHWMRQIRINCTQLHHHLFLSGKIQVSLCDKSSNQYISLGLQVISSWVMWNLSQVSQRDKINNQTPQKVFIDQRPQEHNTEVKVWAEYRPSELKINSGTKIWQFYCLHDTIKSPHNPSVIFKMNPTSVYSKPLNISERVSRFTAIQWKQTHLWPLGV